MSCFDWGLLNAQYQPNRSEAELFYFLFYCFVLYIIPNMNLLYGEAMVFSFFFMWHMKQQHAHKNEVKISFCNP